MAFLLLQLGASTAADDWRWVLEPVTRGLYGWAMILTLSGFAMRLLNRSSDLLAHLNTAILPIYVLHQPILLIGAFFLFPLELPLPIEATALILVTGSGSWLVYEVAIRRFDIARIAFGLRRRSAATRRGRAPRA